MLITRLKSMDEILALAVGKTVVICCEGCNEVYFPKKEVTEAQNSLLVSRTVLAVIASDYMCRSESLELQAQQYMDKIDIADTLLIFSCGVGVQTIAELFINKQVLTACDTYPLPGCQGVTPLEYDCDQCGECYLNDTGGVCPITTCPKSLVNGQCGGAKNGKCEINSNMECGWERINKRLINVKSSETRQNYIKIRDFSKNKENTE
jgi:electron transport complex protein RnfC